MLLRKEHGQDQSLDHVRQEVLLAVKVSAEEIEATACTPDLYGRLRLRIAAQREQRTGKRGLADDRRAGWRGLVIPTLMGPGRSQRWTLTAAAVLLVVAVALLLELPRPSRELTKAEQSTLPREIPAQSQKDIAEEPPSKPQEASVVEKRPAPIQQRHSLWRHKLSERRTSEVATDFFPLTFTADATAQVSGHLVRVTVPRSAMVAMGLPMNVDRAGELVRADVFIGDDGLARAIRFIQ